MPEDASDSNEPNVQLNDQLEKSSKGRNRMSYNTKASIPCSNCADKNKDCMVNTSDKRCVKCKSCYIEQIKCDAVQRQSGTVNTQKSRQNPPTIAHSNPKERDPEHNLNLNSWTWTSDEHKRFAAFITTLESAIDDLHLPFPDTVSEIHRESFKTKGRECLLELFQRHGGDVKVLSGLIEDNVDGDQPSRKRKRV